MLQRLQKNHPVDDISPVVSAAEVIACQEAVRETHIDGKVRRYLLEIVQGTRTHDDIALGCSPRGSLALMRSSQAFAAVNGRGFVLPDDIKRMILPVLGHRLILKPESRLRKVTVASLLKGIVEEIRVPTLANQEAPADDFKE
jgi:MoxR-like ATPase